MYEDMPTPGTRQWGQWFNALDRGDQQQVIFDFGLNDANTPVAGNQMGTMQPEISSQGYGMIDQLAPPPVINSKGVIQPSGTEQVQKQLNLFQDENSLMTDNVLAAIAGQYSPTAFTPTYQGQGNPVTQGGLRNLMSLSQGGGWEGFMANQMLPKDYGGGGMTPSQAKAALMKIVMQPESDSVTPEARGLRDELLTSLPLRYETSGESLDPSKGKVNKDLTTAQGIANTYDLGSIDEVSRGWQKDLASDPIAGYTDPKTGLAYQDAKEIKTPTMEWFDKYGLPYANKSYADPDQIASFQDATAPWQYQGQGEMEDAARQSALDANAAARGELGTANDQMDILSKAYQQANQGGLQDRGTWSYPESKSRPQVMGSSINAPNGSINPGGLYSPPVNYNVVAQQSAQDQQYQGPAAFNQPKFLMSVDEAGNYLGLAPDQKYPRQPWKTENTTKDGVTTTKAVADESKPQYTFERGAILPSDGPDLDLISQLVPGLSAVNDMTKRRKIVTVDDLAPARQRIEMAKKAAAATVPGIQAASHSSPTAMARQMAQAKMIGLSLTGRTPLSDTLAGRMMAARSAGVYG